MAEFIRRRKFLKGVSALSFFTASALRAVGDDESAPKKRKKNKVAADTPVKDASFAADYQVNPCRLYLEDAALPLGVYDFSKDQILSFDNVLWSIDKKKESKSENLIIGSLTISRRRSGGGIVYAIEQKAPKYLLKGELVCADDNFLTPSAWSFTNTPVAPKGSAGILKYAGSLKNGVLNIEAGSLKKQIACNVPLVTQWQLLDGAHIVKNLAQAQNHAVFPDAYALLEPRIFKADGEGLAYGKTGLKYSAWISYGAGAPPWHVLAGANNESLGLTCFVNSWILKKVEDIKG